MFVARLDQLGRQHIARELLAAREHEAAAGHQRTGRQQQRRRCGGGHEHVDVALKQTPQGVQPVADQVLVRRKVVVGQGLPVGKELQSESWIEPSELLHHPLGIGRLGGEHHDPPWRQCTSPVGKQIGIARTPTGGRT